LTKSTYLDLITETVRRNGLDPALLIAMVPAESNLNANAESRSGATGLMQLLPALAEQNAGATAIIAHEGMPPFPETEQFV
jgi:soluble lytic murein transglycosylase-like protein